MHLLHLEFNKQDELTEICLMDSAAGPPSGGSRTILAMEPVKPSVTVTEPAGISATQALHVETADNPLAQFQSDQDVQELLYVAERYLGHQLSHTETETILYWLD